MNTIPNRSASFYGPVDDAERERSLNAYIGFLNARNGTLDMATGTLPNREASLTAMNASPVRYEGRVSQADFDRLLAHWNPSDAALTPELLVLIVLCRMNDGEAYGVRVVKEAQRRRNEGVNDLRTKVIAFAQKEEEYHTRILKGSAHHFGITVSAEYKPTMALKVLIHALARAPKPFFHPILYGSEVAGVFLFNWALNRIREMIKEPALREVLEARMMEILVDELGHVAFNRLVLSERSRGIGQFLAGQTIKGMTWITPELAALGFDKNAQSKFAGFDVQHLPEEARRRGFFA
jgi:hypothetical protein